MLMNTPENLSAELNALNEEFKQSEEYFLIQKIQMQSTAVSSAIRTVSRKMLPGVPAAEEPKL